MFSRYFKFNLAFVLFLILLSSSFAICLNSPSFIRVNSGNNFVGDFNTAYLNSPELIYIKSDLDEYPLKVDFYFEGQENDCFSSEDDVQMRLFSSGILISANSIANIGTQTVARFTFDIDTIAPNSFNSNYIIKNKNNLVGTEDIIKFGTDDEAPIFTTFNHLPSNVLILPNTTVSFNYGVEDAKSTLDFLRIVRGATTIINFNDANKTYTGSFSENLLSSRNYQFTVRDKLANEASRNVNYVVDGSGPVFSDFKVESYTRNEFGTRKVSFSVEVQDVSYGVVNTSPIVVGDFTSINNVDLAKSASCLRIDGKIDSYRCSFDDVDITLLNDTTQVSITLSSTDVLGNSNSQSFTKEIFYDTKGPVVTEFYLENVKGEKNIFNALDTDAKIVVKFTDESALSKNDIRLFPDFDGIETFLIVNCDNVTNNKGTCVWNLDSSLSKYSGIEKGNIVYRLTLVDVYGNPTTQSVNLTINNEKPQITNVELIETTDIKDRIVNSGEKINFRIFIKDSNLKFDVNSVYGDFSSIDFRDGMDKKSASCNYYNESLIQCDFTAIIVQNGYMKRNVSFVVSDTAGNVVVKDYPVEIFAIGNEVFSSFRIPGIVVTNALDRYVIKNAGLDAWFEGKIELQDGNSDIKVVNYQLKGCNDSSMNPVLLGERKLYPSEVQVSNLGNIEPDKNFIVKVEVKTHPNYQDLQTDQMTCTMSILKRDNEQIYPAELVEFNLQFEYFNLPYDNLLSANAANILTMIDDAEFLGSWFDTLFKIYNIFNSVCGLITKASGLMTSYSTIVTTIQYAMSAGSFTTGGLASKLGEAYNTESWLNEIRATEPIRTICDFVTCNLDINKAAGNPVKSYIDDFVYDINSEVGLPMCAEED